MTNKNFEILLNELLDKQIAFASWFFPGDNKPHLIISNPSEIDFFDQFNHLNGEQGFVFAPFSITDQSPVILLKPGKTYNGYEEILNCNTSEFEAFSENVLEEEDEYIDYFSYIQTIDKTVSDIKKGLMSKVIISRRLPAKRSKHSIGNVFLKLQEQTPNAFSYLVNLPIAGIWMGATPEILLKKENNIFETVSLAGTQTRKEDSEYWWHTKDIEEQAFVSRYMLDIFFKYKIGRYTTIGPESLESGKVAHLKTSFFFPCAKINDQLGSFINDLHPTPAVCGLPKEPAAEYIRKKEKHRRKYYTGYLGPWKLNNDLRLFVNLRCMEVKSDHFVLYVGGGITSKSDSEKEWEETIQKAQTLLSVINNTSE